MVLPLSQTYLEMMNGFKEQCQEVIENFIKKGSLQFDEFAKEFRSQNLHLIYEFYGGSFYYNDFKEDSLQVAKAIMLKKNFIGGLYLMYALHFIQEEPKQTVRLEFNDLEFIKHLVKGRTSNIADLAPLYVFSKLMKNEAFSYTVFSREFSMEGNHRSRLLHSEDFISKGHTTQNKSVWLEKLMEDFELTDDLRKVESDYLLLKDKIKQESSELNLNLELITNGTFTGLAENLANDKHPLKETSIGSRRYNLKHRTLQKKRHRLQDEVPNGSQPVVKKRRKTGKVGRPKKNSQTLEIMAKVLCDTKESDDSL